MTLTSEGKEFIGMLETFTKDIERFLKTFDADQIIKNAESSERVRKEGNRLFVKAAHSAVTHREIFRLYCKSVALAPENSEQLALAYGNRSAFLYHIEKFVECVIDIDRAVRITSSRVLKVKLLCRKMKCLSAIGKSKDESIFNEIRMLLDEIPEDDKIKTTLLRSFEETEASFTTVKARKHTTKQATSRDVKEVSNAFTIKRNKKYGRHLIATSDIEPGEIIFVENCYVSCLDIKKAHTNCQHCFAICWSGIPCDNCAWAMFCSEKCMQEAMENYHDLECFIIPYHSNDDGTGIFWNIHVCIRMVILALREAGGVDQLKEKLEEIDGLASDCNDYLVHNGIKIDFATVYNLSTDIGSRREDIKGFSIVLVRSLTIIAQKFSSSEGITQCSRVKDLLEDEDIVFLGALFVRVLRIRHTNAVYMTNGLDVTMNSKKREDRPIIRDFLGVCVAPTNSLINHSCIPNVKACFMKNNKVSVVAVQSIRKNAQLFFTYFGSSFDMPKTARQNFLKQYQLICDCAACLHDWKFEPGNNPVKEIDTLEWQFYKKTENLRSVIFDETKKCNLKDLKELCRIMKQATQRLPPSSWIICTLGPLIHMAFCRIYGYEENTRENMFSSCGK